ncbi:MAG: ATP-binding cassette domain-containing protein, partial [Frankiales bacterium]|nr:ATP-binding cassette domain-containing protein [Frankiales bacterium]
MPALEVRGLRASYGDTTVLVDLSFSVGVGELVTLLGANGSGKSTALRCLAGLRPQDSGDLLLHGEPLGGADRISRTRVAMVFQRPQLVQRLSVLDNVCTGALGRLGLRESASRLLFPAELRREAMACLDRVGLADRAADRAGRLSGGQQQRVAIARALCQRAPLLLADEPVSALDPASAEQILELLAYLAHTDRLAIVMVLHQPDLARRYSDRIIGLHEGRAVFDLRPSKVTVA